MMAQTTFSVRMDEQLKQQFDSLCADFGMNASVAFNVFARAVVRERKIPFEIISARKEVTREDGMRAFLALREEAKENGLHPQKYIEFLLKVLPSSTTGDLEKLLPWSAELPDECYAPQKMEDNANGKKH